MAGFGIALLTAAMGGIFAAAITGMCFWIGYAVRKRAKSGNPTAHSPESEIPDPPETTRSETS